MASEMKCVAPYRTCDWPQLIHRSDKLRIVDKTLEDKYDTRSTGMLYKADYRKGKIKRLGKSLALASHGMNYSMLQLTSTLG